MKWLLIAGSLAAVLGLALAARLLGLGGAALESEAEAMAIAEAECPGFRALGAALEGGGATVTGEDGRVLKLKPHGAHFVVEDADA